MQTVDEYLSDASSEQRAYYEQLRRIVHEYAPTATEVISYGIPTFKVDGRPLIYFGAFTKHMSLFPASDGMIEAAGSELATFRTGKGTLQFTGERPIPESMLRDIVAYRYAELHNN